MNEPTEPVDNVELLHLAVEAIGRQDHGRAIEYLKSLTARAQPSGEYARAAFLLASEYAQIGLIDRAIEQMAQSIEVEPAFHIARFQLGLLHLTSGRAADAADVWAPLEKIDAGSSEHFLVHFKRGLEALAKDDFDQCREMLRLGMAGNTLNAPLNLDMSKVLQALVAVGSKGLPPIDASAQSPDTAEEHLFLSAYRGQSRH